MEDFELPEFEGEEYSSGVNKEDVRNIPIWFKFLIGIGISLGIVIVLLFVVNLVKSVTTKQKVQVSEQTVQTSTVDSSSSSIELDLSEVSNSTGKSKVESSQTTTKSSSTANFSSSEVKTNTETSQTPQTEVVEVEKVKEFLPTSAVSSTVLTNTAIVENISLVSDEGLLALFEVKLKMGSTSITLKLNYDTVSKLSVGQQVTVKYSKVEGFNKVVILSIQ